MNKFFIATCLEKKTDRRVDQSIDRYRDETSICTDGRMGTHRNVYVERKFRWLDRMIDRW